MSRPRKPPQPAHVPVPMDKRLRPGFTKHKRGLAAAQERANGVLLRNLMALREVVA